MHRVGGALLELEPRVDVLGVLADDDEVEVVAQVASALVSLDRPHERVQIEGLAQGDIDAAEAAADRCRDRTLERNLVLADRLQNMVGQGCAVLSDGSFARLVDVPLELDSRSLENPYCGFADLGADAVARDQRYCVLSQSV